VRYRERDECLDRATPNPDCDLPDNESRKGATYQRSTAFDSVTNRYIIAMASTSWSVVFS
jgi:hypothetical protein